MSKSAIAITATLAVLIAASSGYWVGTRRPVPVIAVDAPARNAVKPAPAATVVEAARVMRQALPQTITTVGSLRSDESVTVRPEVAGRISDILFK